MFLFQSHIWILRFANVQNKFQQTNKTKINHINDNHIMFEVSLHFWRFWPTVCHCKLKMTNMFRVPDEIAIRT